MVCQKAYGELFISNWYGNNRWENTGFRTKIDIISINEKKMKPFQPSFPSRPDSQIQRIQGILQIALTH